MKKKPIDDLCVGPPVAKPRTMREIIQITLISAGITVFFLFLIAPKGSVPM